MSAVKVWVESTDVAGVAACINEGVASADIKYPNLTVVVIQVGSRSPRDVYDRAAILLRDRDFHIHLAEVPYA